MPISRVFILVAAIAAALLGAAVIVGWHTRNIELIQISASFVPMQYNTALGFLLSGLGLALSISTRASAAFAVAYRAVSALVFLLGFLTLAEYVFGVDLRIDQLFMQHYVDLHTSAPGRMAPNTALCFTLVGLSLAISVPPYASRLGSARFSPAALSVLSALIFGLGLVAFTGYLTEMETAYGWGSLTKMAVHTAVGFLIISMGLHALAWQREAGRGDRLPIWLPWPVGIATVTVAIALWQALHAAEVRASRLLGDTAITSIDDSVLIFGMLIAITVLAISHEFVRSRKDDSASATSSRFSALLVLFVGSGLAVGLYKQSSANFRQAVTSRFEAAVEQHVSALERGLGWYTGMLYDYRSFYESSADVTQETFLRLAEHDLGQLDALDVILVAEVLPAADRKMAAEESDAQSGRPMQLFDSPDDPQVPSPTRDYHLPVTMTAPLMDAFVGLDLASIDWVRQIYEDAMSTRTVLASRAFNSRIIEEPGKRLALVIAFGGPGAAESIAGSLVAAVFRIDTMLNNVFTTFTAPSGLRLRVRDTDPDVEEDLLFEYASADADAPESLVYTTTEVLEIGGRTWRIEAAAANSIRYPETK